MFIPAIFRENVSKAGNENSHRVRYKAINCKHVLLLFANYLCCALLFFQHYWKVVRLIVPTFFLVRWMSVLKIFPQNLGIQNHHLLQQVANGFSCDSVIFFLISIFFSLKTARFLRSINWYWSFVFQNDR